MDKFLLATNPFRPDQSGHWIIHMLNPIAIIEVHGEHDPPIKEGKIWKEFNFRNRFGAVETWRLSVYHFFTTDFLTEADQQTIPILNKAWRWYRAYLESLDSDKIIDDAAQDN